MFEALKQKLNETKIQLEELSEDFKSSVKVPTDIRNQRLEICKDCDQFHSTQFCKLCGCFMPAKSWLSNSSCPLKKWISIKQI